MVEVRQLPLAGLVLWWSATSVAAGSGTLELEWNAPPECPGKAEVVAGVEQLVGAGAPSGRQLTVRALVAKTDSQTYGLNLQMTLDGVGGERVLTASSCRALTDAAIVSMALALNPDLKWPEVKEPGGAPGPAPLERPAPSAPPPRAEPGPPPRHLHLVGRTLFGVRAGSLPRASPEFGLGLGTWATKGGLSVSASYLPPVDAPHVRIFRMLSSSAVACLTPVPSLPAGACGGFDVSWVTGRGDDIAHRQTDSVYWVSAAFGVTAALRLSPEWRLRLDGQVLVPLHRPAATVEGLGDVYRPDPLAGRACVGVEMTIL